VIVVTLATLVGASAARPTFDEAGGPAGGGVPCGGGSVRAVIAGKRACLKAGQRCKPKLSPVYQRYGFRCGGNARLARKPRVIPKPPVPKPPLPPQPREITLTVSGPPVTVFDWTTDKCEDIDIPDLPVRAFRDAAGNVQLLAAHYVNRRFIGSDLDHLTHPCAVVLGSAYNADPATYADHEWIAATYTPDGTTVYALIHDEYHGWEHPGQCTSGPGNEFNCWYNAITLAVSSNAGATYVDQPAPRLVASLPFKYVHDEGAEGVFTPSNIVRNPNDGYYYSLAYLNIRNTHFGRCLIRTNNLADPGSWRAWSGMQSFDFAFGDPYGPNPPSPTAPCEPVPSFDPLDLQPDSLLYSTVARQWILVGQALEGAYFTLSSDLITWSPPQLFMPKQVTWNYKCGDPDPIAYPTLIDPTSTSRNFETVGETAYLYFTQFHYSNCRMTLDRDLVRVAIDIRPR
jgi:hypothetical protein